MSGRILQQARKDAQRILNSGGFEEMATLTHSSGAPSVSVSCIHSKHWQKFDIDNSSGYISSKNAHVCFNEKDLEDLFYPIRNLKTKNVEMINHLVSVTDSTGLVKNYVINQTFPNETLGLIVCILGDHK